ncbi:UDP-glycosyltransferase 83A1 [Impatiens glandulifera]|uniref:UDP-glycosyltransferase 83A1 n=1 Tax=Impatiens glandulifera TaxID=253017 RepID=UPI001FB1943E|nr:UDP-glycosyltransferase 83A1 [Impatiens glandulifera]
MGKPHVLAIPYPAQGHVIPMMELCHCLDKQGFKVSFVNSDYNHKRIINSFTDDNNVGDHIHLVSIPDGLDPLDDRNDLKKLTESIFSFMPEKLEDLINQIDDSDDDKVTCVVADHCMGWAIEVAAKMGIKTAAFWPATSALLSLSFSIPKLLEDGIINQNGTPVKKEMVKLSPTMPSMNPVHFTWACIADLETQKTVFDTFKICNETVKLAQTIICNTSIDLESAAFSLRPEIIPIGPLLAHNRLGNQAGHFWPDDSSCLKWLDDRPLGSVIYVAFGSFTIFDETQFRELAIGLEMTNFSFLWVVRPDSTNGIDYPKGFIERVGDRGLMVSWAPQQRILAHPALACFVTHCGWNSTQEGVGNGLPLICWPYFADQFLNESYICDVWRVGLRLDKDETGIIRSEEIKDKIVQLLEDKDLKRRVLNLKEMVMKGVKEGGTSHKNLNNFIQWLKT